MQSTKAAGRYGFEIVRDGVVVDRWEVDNIVPAEGIKHALDVTLAGSSQVSSWFLGLFQGNYNPVAGDTAATFPSSATECVAYTENSRQACPFPASTAGTSSSVASPSVFTFNSTATVYGSFVASASGKNATTGVLLSAAKFPQPKSLGAGDILRCYYALSLTSA